MQDSKFMKKGFKIGERATRVTMEIQSANIFLKLNSDKYIGRYFLFLTLRKQKNNESPNFTC